MLLEPCVLVFVCLSLKQSEKEDKVRGERGQRVDREEKTAQGGKVDRKKEECGAGTDIHSDACISETCLTFHHFIRA